MTYDIDIVLIEGESYTVEFKERPDNDLPEEVCAFANASGGFLSALRTKFPEVRSQ